MDDKNSKNSVTFDFNTINTFDEIIFDKDMNFIITKHPIGDLFNHILIYLLKLDINYIKFKYNGESEKV